MFPRHPYTPPHSVYPAALMSLSAGEMSSDSTSGRTSHGSGSHSPNLSSVPHSVRYNPISVSSVVRSGREHKRCSSKHTDFSDDDDDFAPASAPTARMRSIRLRRKEIRSQRIESEQWRRDELRDGYRRLKDALPVSNQKSSKLSAWIRSCWPHSPCSPPLTSGLCTDKRHGWCSALPPTLVCYTGWQ
jgi:hypothetical protein